MTHLALQPATEPDRPIALTPDFSGMPAELQPLQIWVVWRYEWDGKKRWRKVPYIPVVYNPKRMRKAKSNDPTTWRSYTDAKKVYLACPDLFDGVGICADGDLVFGDFDHAYDAATDQCSDFARTYMPQSYAEQSVGGEGAHFIAHGTIERARKKTRGELYAAGSPRFLTITGRRLPNQPATIEHCQEAIERYAEALDNEPGSKRTGRTGTPRPSSRTQSRKQLAAGIPEVVRDEARQLYRTQAERLERRFKAAAKREETQWWFVARRDYAGFHARYPFVGLYDADGALDPSQARMATGRAIRGLGFTLSEYAALMTLYFTNDHAAMIARWGNINIWWEELADVWEKSAPAKRGIWQPRTPQAVAKKPKGRASDHGANVERVFQLLQAHRVGEQSVITTAELAAEADMHRVTLCGILTELRKAGRIKTDRLGRYGGLVITFLDVAILSELPIETPTAATPLEETHTHNCVSSENAQTGYSSEVPATPRTLSEAVAVVISQVDPKEFGRARLKTVRETLAIIYGYTDLDAINREIKVQESIFGKERRECWRMQPDALFARIQARATSIARNIGKRQEGKYRKLAEIAREVCKRRGLKMPERPTKEKPVTPHKAVQRPTAPLLVQPDLFADAPAQSPYYIAALGIADRLRARQQVQP